MNKSCDTGNVSSETVEKMEKTKLAGRLQERKPEKLRLKQFTSQQVRLRTTSSMWESTEFDPFQVFEVEHDSCLDLEVTIHKGEEITKGSAWKDLVDTPDPYVVLRIPGSSNSSRRTSHVDNTVNPKWDTTFHFYLDPRQEHILHVFLMDSNYTVDEQLGEDYLCVNTLRNDEPTDHIFNFPGGSKVYTTLTLRKNRNPDLRFSLALCDEEKDFLQLRRLKVLSAMKSVLGPKAPESEKQVPIVAVLGSGGGFRAMTCLSAAVKALHESGILDCTTYISGLSGSSWYISTLYAHDEFPHVTHAQIQKELRASVTNDWKWQLMKTVAYLGAMLNKYKMGQPVSFTDFFGHLLGDVLLKGKKEKKLTDVCRILKTGDAPFPLYTCLHAKKSVSCKQFSEWVEFSPYEIGIAKYGTFMKTKHFGSKFIVGKVIKEYPESPLHFLQGVWGSAFTILIKRLVMEGGKKDIIQIMRESQKEQDIREIADNCCYESGEDTSDSEEEKFVYANDDDEVHDHDITRNGVAQKQEELDTECILSSLELKVSANDKNDVVPTTVSKEESVEDVDNVQSEPIHSVGTSSRLLKGSHDDLNLVHSEKLYHDYPRKFSLDYLSNSKTIQNHDSSSGDKSLKHISGSCDSLENKKSKSRFEFPSHVSNVQDERKISTQSDPGMGFQINISDTATSARLKRQRVVKRPKIKREKGVDDKTTDTFQQKDGWKNRRETLRKSRVEKSGFIKGIKESIMTGANILNSRAGRAGEILSPFRGLSLKNSFPISPFAVDEEEEVDSFGFGAASRYQPLDHTAKKLFVVDSGLAFNSPYPLLLRPQRAVDLYISFDFSQRGKDSDPPFKELLLAEKWAAQNKVPFPPIESLISQYVDKPVQECYVFRHPSDPSCPVIIHFCLVNNKFRKYKKPGYPRNTKEEYDFADFSIFDDPHAPYASTNFVFEPIQFDRLTQLVEFNTLLHIETIKEEIVKVIQKKQVKPVKPSFETVAKMLTKLLSPASTGVSHVPVGSPPTEFFNALSEGEMRLKINEENSLKLQKHINRLTSIDSDSEDEYKDANEYPCILEEENNTCTATCDIIANI